MALDGQAIDGLYRVHARHLLVFFARRTIDAEAATDLVAETFAVAFRDRHQFRGSSPQEAAAWLFGIARHQLSNYYRRGIVEREAIERLAVERRELTDAEIERIDELAGLAALRERVRIRLQQLEGADQEILRLRIVEERGYGDIAALLGVNEPAARARVSRALSRLRALINDSDDPLVELVA